MNMNKPKPIPVTHVKPIEPDTFDENNLDDKQSAIMFEYFLNERINKYLDALYQGRGLNKLKGFRESLNTLFEQGGFEPQWTDKDDKRSANDEIQNTNINRRLRALLGHEAFVRIQDAGRGCKLSNAATLRVGLQSAIDRWAL